MIDNPILSEETKKQVCEPYETSRYLFANTLKFCLGCISESKEHVDNTQLELGYDDLQNHLQDFEEKEGFMIALSLLSRQEQHDNASLKMRANIVLNKLSGMLDRNLIQS